MHLIQCDIILVISTEHYTVRNADRNLPKDFMPVFIDAGELYCAKMGGVRFGKQLLGSRFLAGQQHVPSVATISLARCGI